MKKLLVVLLIAVFSLSSLTYAEEYEMDQVFMEESQSFIGISDTDAEVFEFEKMNPEYHYTGCSRLMTYEEIEEELDRRNIAYTSISIEPVNNHDFLIITLENGDNYGLDFFYTSTDECYVTMSSFYLFCQNYYGFGYDFFGI